MMLREAASGEIHLAWKIMNEYIRERVGLYSISRPIKKALKRRVTRDGSPICLSLGTGGVWRGAKRQNSPKPNPAPDRCPTGDTKV